MNTVLVGSMVVGRNCESVSLGNNNVRDSVIVDGEVFRLGSFWKVTIIGPIKSLTLLDDCHKIVVEGDIKYLQAKAEVHEDKNHVLAGQSVLYFPDGLPNTEGAFIDVHGDVEYFNMSGCCGNTRVSGHVHNSHFVQYAC